MRIPLLLRHRIKCYLNCKLLKFCTTLLLGYILSNPYCVLAQEEDNTWKYLFEEIVESLAQKSDIQLDYTDLLEQMENLHQNPVPLNKNDLKGLERLIMLNSFQIKSLQKYLEEHGSILSLFELQFIYGFDQNTSRLLEPFVTLENDNTESKEIIRKPLRYGKHQLFLRAQKTLEIQDGFLEVPDSLENLNPNSRYMGPAWKLYTRYGYSYRDKFAFGFTAENDAGEPFFTGSNKTGYDFYSGFIQVNNIWKIKSLIVGDYEPQFGQGLTLGSGFKFGKSAEVLMLERRANGIKKYSSTNENNFFRGLATTFDFGLPEISLFVSSKKIDANILEWDSIAGLPILVSKPSGTGIHGTPNQIFDEKALKETLYGFNISIRRNIFKVGLSMLGYNYGTPISSGGDIYNDFLFQGQSGSKIGLDYKLSLKKGMLYGEVSHNPGYGWAILQGGLFQLHEQLSLTFLYRNYSKDFHPIYSNAFGEGSENQNEKGFYTGMDLNPFRMLKISAYVDIFSFPWLKWQVSAPSKGWEYFIQVEFVPHENLNMYLRFQNEKKEENISDEGQMVELDDRTRMKARYQVSYSVNPSLELRNRVEWSGYRKGSRDEQGFLIYQDIIYHLQKFPLDLSFRFALFDTDSYDTRIYAYESDVLYAFSIPPYYGKGIRTYLVLHTAISKNIDLWFRISQTSFSDREIVGSGLNTIQDSKKTDIKIQMRLKF